MNGQLKFDEFMNITEEKPSEHKQERVPMVDPCYYCLCRSCINNAESLTVNPEEVPYDWHPCFFCDICNNFDGESPENMEREECHEYVIDDYHARQNRKKFRTEGYCPDMNHEDDTITSIEECKDRAAKVWNNRAESANETAEGGEAS
jgi:hypothetical protein